MKYVYVRIYTYIHTYVRTYIHIMYVCMQVKYIGLYYGRPGIWDSHRGPRMLSNSHDESFKSTLSRFGVYAADKTLGLRI